MGWCDRNMAIVTITAISIVFLFTIGANAKQTLRLGVLISQEGDFDFTGFIPAMNLALETIENDTTLPFNFSITLNDSMVRAPKSLSEQWRSV